MAGLGFLNSWGFSRVAGGCVGFVTDRVYEDLKVKKSLDCLRPRNGLWSDLRIFFDELCHSKV